MPSSQLPIFFHKEPLSLHQEPELSEDASRHIIQVLRMKRGDRIQLTDGNGLVASGTIVREGKRKVAVSIDHKEYHKAAKRKLHLGVGFTKNAGRNEWLLEKATELGVSSIMPLICVRSEHFSYREERWNNILVAALLQSQQYYLPHLSEPLPLPQILQQFNGVGQKLVGHCYEAPQRKPLAGAMKKDIETVVLIGPEGDFTEEEVAQMTNSGYQGVSMGKQRLRTETAALSCCAYFNLINNT